MGADYKEAAKSIFGGSSFGALAANLTRYIHPSSGPLHNVELRAQMTIPFNCRITNFYVRSDVAPGVGETLTFLVYLNGVPTALTLQLAGAAQVDAGPDADVVVLAAGDEISVQVVNSLNAAAAFPSWSFEVNR